MEIKEGTPSKAKSEKPEDVKSNSKSPRTPRAVSPSPAEKVAEMLAKPVDPPVVPSDTKKSASEIRKEFFAQQRKLPKFKFGF